VLVKPTLCSILLALPSGCKDEATPPPPPTHTPTIQLSLADTGVTELWLRVRLVDSTQARSVKLLRDSQVVAAVTPATLDTVIHDGLLSAGRSYSYKAYRLTNNMPVDSTQPVSATTLDTTSHNFVWRVDIIGMSSSLLRDVAILASTTAWAVGELFLRDSTGNRDPIPYNLARWDGSTWTADRVLFPICDQNGNEVGTAPFGANTLFLFLVQRYLDDGGWKHCSMEWDWVREELPPTGDYSGGTAHILRTLVWCQVCRRPRRNCYQI
jgi:hypothetical protein